MPKTVAVQSLNHYFGEGELRKQALFDNNLEVRRGEIVIMTGPSGSGKTTLLTLIGTLRTVQEGSLKVLGNELCGADRDLVVRLRQEMGFIFQAHNLFESLTAYQNVNMAAELVGLDPMIAEGRINSLLTRLGLGDTHPLQAEVSLRGAEAACRHRPRPGPQAQADLADEPTAALDEKSGREVVTLFQELARDEGCTIIMVTHDNRILDVADRIVNMVDGQIKSDVAVQETSVICEFLKEFPLFADLTPNTLAEVADKMMVHEAGAGRRRHSPRRPRRSVLSDPHRECRCALIDEAGQGAESCRTTPGAILRRSGTDHRRTPQCHHRGPRALRVLCLGKERFPSGAGNQCDFRRRIAAIALPAAVGFPSEFVAAEVVAVVGPVVLDSRAKSLPPALALQESRIMNVNDALRTTLDTSAMVLGSYVGDLSDAELMTRPGPGCNHIAWQLGHLIASEAHLLTLVAPESKVELPEGFAEKHSKQTIGDDDPAHFCTKAEYMDLFEQVHAATRAAIDKTTAAELDQPGPEHFRSMFPTLGHVYVLIATHGMMHAGQLVPIRRALGKPVVI